MLEKRALIIMALACVVLTTSAFSCTPHRVAEGTLRDTLFSVERTENGAWRIFMTHDDVAGYCTASEDMGRKAAALLQTHNGEVLVEFRDPKIADKEFSWLDKSDCGTFITGTDSSMKMFILYSISAVSHREAG